jgi:hypothetical protein
MIELQAGQVGRKKGKREKMNTEKKIKIQWLTGLSAMPIPPMNFFVELESEHVIQIDNHAEGALHCAAMLMKISDKLLENSAGQQFEIVSRD